MPHNDPNAYLHVESLQERLEEIREAPALWMIEDEQAETCGPFDELGREEFLIEMYNEGQKEVTVIEYRQVKTETRLLQDESEL